MFRNLIIAFPDNDFNSTVRTVFFPANSATGAEQSVSFPINDDIIDEDPEGFIIVLYRDTNLTSIEVAFTPNLRTTLGRINDNDRELHHVLILFCFIPILLFLLLKSFLLWFCSQRGDLC